MLLFRLSLFCFIFGFTSASAAPHYKVIQGSILHFLSDPGSEADPKSYQYLKNGGLVIHQGRVAGLIDYSKNEAFPFPKGASIEKIDHKGKLILPGFIDTHIHYPQSDMIAAYGEQLLEWLKKYTFPTETQFSNQTHAREVADFFIDELLRNGTTTALVFGTVHPQSIDAFFESAQRYDLRMVAGKVMMDRNAIPALQDTAQTSYNESKQLIQKWHNKGRALYAVTPRFAPTSSKKQLEAAGRLLKENPGVYLHTHVAENRGEVEWVSTLFPEARSYLDVYDRYGLVQNRSVYAHAIHLEEQDYDLMAQKGAAISFCPTSNLFLGSGLFNLKHARSKGIRVGMGTDVGAGTSFNMFQTLNEAYKVTQLRGDKLNAFRALYLATLGSAEALYLEDRIGNFKKGNEADFVVIDDSPTPLMSRRMGFTKTLDEKLFVLMMLGDDRSIEATYVMGKEVYRK